MRRRYRVGDRPEPARRVVEHHGCHGAGTLGEEREQLCDAVRWDIAAEPTQAGNEHELELRDHRAFDTNEQVVKRAVLEMILDPGTPDPTDTPVHDNELAMVDVP